MPQGQTVTHPTRRRLLKLGATLALGCLSFPALAHTGPAAERRLQFHNLHTGEKLDRAYWAEGRYLPEPLAEIDGLLRDFRTGEVKPIDRKLLDLLYLVRSTLNSNEAFEVVSAYRSPATNKMLSKNSEGVAKRSLHMQGKAIDVNLPGRDLNRVHRVAKAFKLGGVGYYPKPGFVHLDTGAVRYW